MKTLLITLTALSFIALPELGSSTSVGRVLMLQRSMPRGALLYKRSLCNTFGGCGAKRSLTYNGMDELVDERRPVGMDTSTPQVSNEIDNGKEKTVLIDDILDEILKLLKKEQKSRQNNRLDTRAQPKEPIMDTAFERPLVGTKLSPPSEGLRGPMQDRQVYGIMYDGN